MFGEPVDTIVEDVVFNIAILPFIALEVSRQTGMAPPDPLVIELVWNETTCWLQNECGNTPKWLGSVDICMADENFSLSLNPHEHVIKLQNNTYNLLTPLEPFSEDEETFGENITVPLWYNPHQLDKQDAITH